MLGLWPLEVRVPGTRDWPEWELAEKVYDTIRTTVVGVREGFCSQELGPEEDDNGVLDQALPLRVEEAARRDVYPTIADMAKTMGGRPNRRVLETVWKHRQVFDPVEPGSVKGYFHRIDLDTKRELRAKIYPLKPEHKEEAPKEIAKLPGMGMKWEVHGAPIRRRWSW